MVVRRHDKRGNAYYLNKSTGKRTSKRGWKISLSHRKEKPSYRERKVGGKKVKIRLGKVRKGISSQKVTALKKKRSKLYSERSYWRKKLFALIKAKEKQKDINNAKRKLASINGKITKLNRKLGIVYVKKPLPKKKRQVKDGVITSTLSHWDAERELDTILEKDKIKKYIIDGVKYGKTNHLDIVLAFDEMIAHGLDNEQYPKVIFIYDNNTKIVTVYIY